LCEFCCLGDGENVELTAICRHNYPATEYPADKYKQLMSINVDGSFFCAREAGRRMLEAKQRELASLASLD
jgi:NAD(P)-dependent dehydrogenase (short-subunit alcohol dehydrogenase family)